MDLERARRGRALVALLLVLAFYRPEERHDVKPRRFADSLRGLATVVTHGRFLALILITAGFWLIQGQMYASMPKYVLRLIGEGATPEWYANINLLVVVGGRLVALDARGRIGSGPVTPVPERPLDKMVRLLRPATIAVAGVSERLNPGRVILNNLLREGFDPARITLIKPGATSIAGCRCIGRGRRP